MKKRAVISKIQFTKYFLINNSGEKSFTGDSDGPNGSLVLRFISGYP